MKAKELIEKLKEYPDFDVVFGLLEPDGSPYGIGLRRFNIDIDDIGHSDSVVILGPVAEILL